jgi:hypothetical protein
MIRVIKSRRTRWVGLGARVGDRRGAAQAYRVVVGRYEGKSLLGISRLSWEDNIKMNLHEVG